MIPFFRLALFSVLFTLAGVQLSQAQCTNKSLNKEADQLLKPFNFETMAFVQFQESEKHPDLMQSTFTVFKGEKYRVIIIPKGFYQNPIFSVYYGEGESRDIIFSNENEKTTFSYDFVAKKAGVCTIEFSFTAPFVDKDFAEDRCLAFIIGYQD